MKAVLALLALVAVASAHVLTPVVPATGLTTIGAVYPGVSYTSKVPLVQYPAYKYPQYQYVYQPVQNKVVYP
ncbi:unnamed protein product, partial [Allacma fusca]